MECGRGPTPGCVTLTQKGVLKMVHFRLRIVQLMIMMKIPRIYALSSSFWKYKYHFYAICTLLATFKSVRKVGKCNLHNFEQEFLKNLLAFLNDDYQYILFLSFPTEVKGNLKTYKYPKLTIKTMHYDHV